MDSKVSNRMLAIRLFLREILIHSSMITEFTVG
jgi:hypothetical protein